MERDCLFLTSNPGIIKPCTYTVVGNSVGVGNSSGCILTKCDFNSYEMYVVFQIDIKPVWECLLILTVPSEDCCWTQIL